MGRPKNSVERMLIVDVDTAGPCWIWKGAVGQRGHGKTNINGVAVSPTRAFFEHFKGAIPTGHTLTPTCKNKKCVNPAHLNAISIAESVRLGANTAGINARKVLCIRGHALSGGNLYVTSEGRRQCRACRAAASKQKLGE